MDISVTVGYLKNPPGGNYSPDTVQLPSRYDQFVFRRVRFSEAAENKVPDLGGFRDSFARISFHPAARNETLFEAASLQNTVCKVIVWLSNCMVVARAHLSAW